MDLSGARLQYLKREFLSINYFLVEAVDGAARACVDHYSTILLEHGVAQSNESNSAHGEVP